MIDLSFDTVMFWLSIASVIAAITYTWGFLDGRKQKCQ